VLRGNVVLGPKDADKVSKELKRQLGVEVAIMDVNDIGGCEICGSSCQMRELLLTLMSDNPLGQDVEYTPIGILRRL